MALKRLLNEPAAESADTETVAGVLDEFLEWTKENRAPKTYRGYKDFCQAFIDEYGRLFVSDLTTGDVTTWLRKRTTWNRTTKRDAITCLQRGFNWAVKNIGLDKNPIRGMEKPEAETRATVVSPKEFDELLAEIKDNHFKDLLIVSYDCGCRPQEVKELEARHIDLGKQCWVLPKQEAKGKRKTRVIFIPTKRALQIIRKRVKQYPQGKIFRNTRGNSWTASAVKCRFAKLEDKVGKRYRQYDLRHTWITRQLVAGVDSHIVATLAGHADTKMIDDVYSHVADDHRFLLKQAKKGVSGAG